jgi:hypothetical protein
MRLTIIPILCVVGSAIALPLGNEARAGTYLPTSGGRNILN